MTPPAPVSGQIVFRAAVGSVQGQAARVPWEYSLGIGLLHVPPGSLKPESVHGVLLSGGPGEERVGFHGNPRPLCARYPEEEIANLDIGGLFNQMEVASPEGVLGLVAHGGFFVRQTRFPGPEGTETLLVAALMRHGRGQLAERAMYRLGGDIARIALRDPVPCPEAFPIGSAPSQTVAMPIWQARDGLRGIRSSLRLDVIDLCDEMRALEGIEEGDRTPAQAARFKALSRTEAGRIVGVSRGDESFERFKRLLRETEEAPAPAFASYPTAAEIEAHDAAVNRVVQAMFADGPTHGARGMR